MSNYSNYVIKGKTVTLWFGLPAVRRVHEVKFSITNEEGYYNNLGVAHIIYAGYLNACMIREQAPEFVFEDFYGEIEAGFFTQDQDVRWRQGVDAVRIYSESFVVKSLLEQEKKRLRETLQQATTETNTTSQSSSPSPDPNLQSIGTESNSSASGNSE